jgi:hypothetical protein
MIKYFCDDCHAEQHNGDNIARQLDMTNRVFCKNCIQKHSSLYEPFAYTLSGNTFVRDTHDGLSDGDKIESTIKRYLANNLVVSVNKNDDVYHDAGTLSVSLFWGTEKLDEDWTYL